MKSAAFLLAVSAALVAADGPGQQWSQWHSDTPPAPPPAPSAPAVGWTDWVTTVQYVPTTIVNAVTNYVTVTGPGVTEVQKETATEYQTVTQISTVVVSPPPVTVTVTAPGGTSIVTLPADTTTVSLPGGTITVTQPGSATTVTLPGQTSTVTISGGTSTVTVSGGISTVVSLVSSLQTVTQIQTIAQSVVVTETVQQTAATVTNAVTTTVTSVGSMVQTVSISYCTSQALTGLVTCASRIVNPTYTPPTPLPSNYLWGCPPGKLCHPKKDNCNFEQNPPADTYFCAPEECLPVADLPPLDTFLKYENISDTCAAITPIDDYFNLNPTYFGLDFDIFNIFGQPKCSSAAPASTVTVKVSAQPIIVPTTVTAAVTVSVSGGWGNWQASTAAPQVTKRAELADRHVEERAIVVASQCYAVCDYAAAVYQSMGKVPALCSADSPWSSALARVTSCTAKYSATGVTSVATLLNDPLLYCRSNSTKRSLFGRRVFS